MNHHAFVIEADQEEGIRRAKQWLLENLGMEPAGNPDVIVETHGLLSVEEARRMSEVASGAPFRGDHKAVIIAASRAYHESQNALLKLFEEPPKDTYLFLILPSLGGLLPTLRSRVQEISASHSRAKGLPKETEEFLKGGKEKRSAIIKKLTSGKDEDERRENREEAITLVNGIEAAAYEAMKEKANPAVTELLLEISELRGHLYDRSAPVKMILEHLSLSIPSGLV